MPSSSGHHLRKDGDDVDPHDGPPELFSSRRPSGGFTTIRRPATSISANLGHERDQHFFAVAAGDHQPAHFHRPFDGGHRTDGLAGPIRDLTPDQVVVIAGVLRQRPAAAAGTFNSAPASASASVIVSIRSSAMMGRP